MDSDRIIFHVYNPPNPELYGVGESTVQKTQKPNPAHKPHPD
jgi:hypothetical protein